MKGAVKAPTLERIMDWLKDQGVEFTWNRSEPNMTTSCEGHITVNLNMREIKPFVVLHEIFHAIGETEKHKRLWLVDQKELKEELAANEFAIKMSRKMNVSSKEAVEIYAKMKGKILKKIKNKKLAKAEAERRAEACIKIIEEELCTCH